MSKEPTPSIRKALEQSNFDQSKSNPNKWVNRNTNEVVTTDGHYGQREGSGWHNWSNKKSI